MCPSLLLFLLCIIARLGAYAQAPDVLVSGYVTRNDKVRLRGVFDSNSAQGSSDPKVLHYILLGYRGLNTELASKKEACDLFKTKFGESIEDSYHCAAAARLLGEDFCRLATSKFSQLAESKLNAKPSMADIFHIVGAMKATGLKIDSSQIQQLVDNIREKDTSSLILAYAFHIVSDLELQKDALKSYVDQIDELLAQADEVDGVQLYYDNGIFTTTMVAQGILKLVTAYGELPANLVPKLAKMANYFYARRQTNNLRAAAHLVTTLMAMSTNPLLSTVVFVHLERISRVSQGHNPANVAIPIDSPNLEMVMVDVWGETWYSASEIVLNGGGLYSTTAGSTRNLVGPADRGKFGTTSRGVAFQLKLDPTPPCGFYELELKAELSRQENISKVLIGASNVKLPLRVVTDAKVSEASITLLDSDHDRHIVDISLTPGKHFVASTPTGAIKVDSGHQVSLNVRLVESGSSATPLVAHQVFVQLTHTVTSQRITFHCEEREAVGPENAGAKAYQLRLNPSESAADFDYLSGIYRVELIVGDPLLKHPLLWHLADLDLTFTGQAGADTRKRIAQAVDTSKNLASSAAASKRSSGAGVSPIIGEGPDSLKPELEHTFRQPDRRAPRLLAYIFTAACAVPFVGLIIAWGIVGINISNFQCSLSALIFHTGLISVFGLYGAYWYCLDMFTTLRYLAIIAPPTVIAGISVLRAQLSTRHQALTNKSKKAT